MVSYAPHRAPSSSITPNNEKEQWGKMFFCFYSCQICVSWIKLRFSLLFRIPRVYFQHHHVTFQMFFSSKVLSYEIFLSCLFVKILCESRNGFKPDFFLLHCKTPNMFLSCTACKRNLNSNQDPHQFAKAGV